MSDRQGGVTSGFDFYSVTDTISVFCSQTLLRQRALRPLYPFSGVIWLTMLPLHRLAGQQQSQGNSSKPVAYLRAIGSSRLATRALLLLGILTLAIYLFLPPSYSYSEIKESLDYGGGARPPLHRPPPHGGAEHGHDHGIDELPIHRPPLDMEDNSPPLDDAVVAKWRVRAGQVKESFEHAWNGYEKYAFGYDELWPTSNRSTTNLNGWGVTIVDSLSTMQLMGLDDIYERAMVHVRKMHFKDHVSPIRLFLLSACSIYPRS